MTEALEPLEIGVKIGGSIINNLRFADDIDLIAETEENLNQLTEKLDSTAVAYGMEISAEKAN